ncbi:hypothetical protein [Hymenobacter weizhouensis]|uniref:hypothetical protein n=1 Tax=Hymenobacter sp. YIM 151500-1 TaxID=2987689 RepID=UPI0022261E4E|nr:hypothetical protein [Hymenobacter sp. YIM 151500-1]UYZ63425.1 hypothetical protein OIS53_00935 [Hymenobacter sp. YIM 151500-1]
MAANAAPDSLLQKSDDELLYLVQHPEFYHPDLVFRAGRELRRRGVALPQSISRAAPVLPANVPANVPADEAAEEAPRPRTRRWAAAAVAGVAVAGLGWWALAPTPPPPPASPAAAVEVPTELEAVVARPLPTFEALTAKQVQEVRRQLPVADRADTTATGRYLRMARRYWLAENQAAYLTRLALADSLTGTLPGQVDLTQERISWFMRAKAYNQHLTPFMEERLTQMQKGLGLRRTSLNYIKRNYEATGKPHPDKQMRADSHEAQLIAEDLRGRGGRQAPVRGNLSEL